MTTASNKSHDKVLSLAKRLADVKKALRTEYSKKHRYPWIVAYSGGKDSTLLLQLVWEMLDGLSPEKRKREIRVVGNDTLVESPLVIRHLYESLKNIGRAAAKADIPVAVQITKPCIDQTFWVNVIGRGYIPPTRNFRWCTDRMKILPTTRLLEQIVREWKGAVLLIGTRRSESQHRRRNMDRRGVSATRLNPHDSLVGCQVFSPISDLVDDDVWMTLIQRPPPWGGTHRDLITLYRNAGGGECPLVTTKQQAPSCGSSSPRFGCWTCTVVQKDKSLRGLIDSGHGETAKMERLAEFREWLVSLREDDANRLPVRRNGNPQTRKNGSRVFGPFSLQIRKQILRRLRDLEHEVNEPLLQPGELECIQDIWWRDEIREDSRKKLLQRTRIQPEDCIT